MTDVADQYGFCMAAGDKLADCSNYTAGGDSTGGGKRCNGKLTDVLGLTQSLHDLCVFYREGLNPLDADFLIHIVHVDERVLQEERTLSQEERMTSVWLREEKLAKKEHTVIVCLHDKMQGKRSVVQWLRCVQQRRHIQLANLKLDRHVRWYSMV